MQAERSEQLFALAQTVMPGGVSSPVRALSGRPSLPSKKFDL
jgi:glutamate-1-semialdehyde aminotransferase